MKNDWSLRLVSLEAESKKRIQSVPDLDMPGVWYGRASPWWGRSHQWGQLSREEGSHEPLAANIPVTGDGCHCH